MCKKLVFVENCIRERCLGNPIKVACKLDVKKLRKFLRNVWKFFVLKIFIKDLKIPTIF